MNDIERAIEVLKYYKPKGNESIYERGANHKDRESFNLAISALEKQIPKKVKYKTTCPVCNAYNSVWNKKTNTKPGDIVYCWHCGNAIKLDWSVEE